MPVVSLRFYEELNDFLPANRRKREFTIDWRPQNSVKDMIESVGVPHTEIDLILVNGQSVDFSYLVQPDDRISIYPVFEALDIRDVTRLRPEPLRQTRFVLDTHLGKLARYLRLLGFDTLYDNDCDDATLAATAGSGDKRILLTRDHGLLMRKQVTHGYFVRNVKPEAQVREVLARFQLQRDARPFTRCTQCNTPVSSVEKEKVLERLPPAVARRFDPYWYCEGCQRVYWQGSHYDRMQRLVDSLLDG